MITSIDFKNSFLNVNDDFEIKNENAIYLGPNGIGKTTTYEILKSKYPSYGFFSYDDCKEKITKEKKKITISIRTTDIEELTATKNKIIEELDIKTNGFKKYQISSATKAGEYSDYCKELYNNNELAIIKFDTDKLDIFDRIEDITKKEFLLQNIEALKKISITGNELEDIKNKYISNSLKYLKNAIDENDTVCPVCGYDHQSSILELYKQKEKEYTTNLDNVIEKYMILTNKAKEEVKSDIYEMFEIIKQDNLSKEDATHYVIVGKDNENIDKIKKAQKEIMDINAKINDLELERDIFFNNLVTNWTKIEKVLVVAFKDKGVKITKDENNKSIIVTLKRESSTYSTGELNYIVFLINILEFEYSNRTNIVIDDPLSSYDIKKQYEIVFDIMSRLLTKGKKVLIFTHNINLINITNSQNRGAFTYYYMESIKNELVNYRLNIEDNGSILNIEEIIKHLDDSDTNKAWIQLIIEKDTIWDKDSERHNLFHYDEDYIDIESGFSNTDLINMIDNLKKVKDSSFELLSAEKILLISAMRVWVEKKLSDNYNGKIYGQQLFPKIQSYFKHPENWKEKLNIEKEDLTKRKVMLNQNDHYKSQIIPFQYALSISIDELINDIDELKKLFK